MKNKSFLKRPLPNPEMSLQITSMADIFIIVLVFLLKSYASGTVNITPSAGLILPEAQAASTNTSLDALKIEIHENAIQVEGQFAILLKQFQFEGRDLIKNGASSSLSAALGKERERQLLIASHNSEVKIDPRIVVIADQRAPYATLKTVLASAAIHDYTDFKLAVTQRGE